MLLSVHEMPLVSLIVLVGHHALRTSYLVIGKIAPVAPTVTRLVISEAVLFSASELAFVG